MPHTVGILGINGNVGQPTVKLLLLEAERGRIQLVIFYRKGSNTQDIKPKSNVDLRLLDLSGSIEDIKTSIKGINVFLSSISVACLQLEQNLVDALAESPDLVTFIPAVFSTTWNAKDHEDSRLGSRLDQIHAGWDRAKEKGLGLTIVYTGVFDLYWFEKGFLGAPIKENIVWANESQLKNRVPITTMNHLAQALARIVTTGPHTTKGKEYSVVTFFPSGQELVDLYTKLNGRRATVKSRTDSDREIQMNKGPMQAGYWDKWASNGYEYETGGKIVDRQYDGPGLEDVARRFL